MLGGGVETQLRLRLPIHSCVDVDENAVEVVEGKVATNVEKWPPHQTRKPHRLYTKFSNHIQLRFSH
jgi:hypothetical protein